ncbi:MAG: EVE domain-containing protein [Clostridiales bacterium]|nr:EVE domain-containing protein [Clostridiales bacterium]
MSDEKLIVKSFDVDKLHTIFEEYKKRFKSVIWNEENYKWRAIKTFQDNWNVDASNLAEMLNASLKGTSNLLTSARRYPKGMIVEFATLFPDEVRAMFINLFDESVDVYERISNFISKSDELLPRWCAITNKPDDRMHYQNINAVTTYLWLKYPDKYSIYKLTDVKVVAKTLKSQVVLKQGAYAENLRSFMQLYNDIRDEIKKDAEIRRILEECIQEDCYPDPELVTLTADFGFFLSHRYQTNDTQVDTIYGTEYESGLSVEDWIDLLQNKEVFSVSSLEIVKRFKDFGGEATCKQIAMKYGKDPGFYNIGSTKLAKRVIRYTSCPTPEESDGKECFWPVLYTGRLARKDEEGAFVWKLRDEISKALDAVDTTDIELYAQNTIVNETECSYWWLNANPKIWSFSELPVGECQAYELYNANGNKRRIFQNFLDAKVGDKVICYESTPVKKMVALAEVATEQDGDIILFKKTEGLENPIDYQTLSSFEELSEMEYFQNPQGSLFKLTADEYSFIMDLVRDNNPLETTESYEKYDTTNFLSEVFMDKESYNTLVDVLENKKNIILQGAPGVGKTFTAKRLAYAIMGRKDESRIEFVQFHQNYSYEDFVMGYKPNDTGFELRNGIFYRFCQKAANQPKQKFFFIIDEINRGNMSKIFGELLMLIEKDYRGEKATLAYNGMPFSIPENLYIIGMMNTADRSLAMIDYALRRRFSFFEMKPGFNTDAFIKYQNAIGNDTLDELISRICDLNKAIADDKALGKGFCIGHSYFCNLDGVSEERLKSVVKFEIVPMLEEYWFDDEAKLKHWSSTLLGIFK